MITNCDLLRLSQFNANQTTQFEHISFNSTNTVGVFKYLYMLWNKQRKTNCGIATTIKHILYGGLVLYRISEFIISPAVDI